MVDKLTQADASPTTSKAALSKSEGELWAEEWLAERTRPSRQRNLTPSQRKRRARLLREYRNPPSDVTWVGRDSTDTQHLAVALRTSKISFAEIIERLQPGRPATWGLEGTLSGAHQAAPIMNEIGRQAQMIGYLNAFMFFALTALVAMPLILVVRTPRH
jgi:hypothetical protein